MARARRAEDRMRGTWPRAAWRIIKTKRTVKGRDSDDLDAFVDSIMAADLLVVSGAGAITDDFAPLAITILDLVALLNRRGATTAMLGQGIGPIADSALFAKASSVLPRADLIGIREQLCGLPLLRSMGVSPERIFVTGDDAVDLAYRHGAAPEDAHAIGFNVRMARYSGLRPDVFDEVRTALLEAAARHKAELIGLPISQYPKELDASVIDRLLDSGTSTEPPRDATDVIVRTRRCRLVVTGSYHAAVFALAQGIPVVGLAGSDYYVSKFEGLMDQFGAGCSLVRLDAPNLRSTLTGAIDDAWECLSEVRPLLLKAAERQVNRSRSAYESLFAQLTRTESQPITDIGRT
jgi:colanic acid/amylovoran biosynthesis protein